MDTGPPVTRPRRDAGTDADRLSALDVSYLAIERRTAPMAVAGLVVLAPGPTPIDVDAVRARLAARVRTVPRLTHRLGPGTPGSRPGWVPDDDFDVRHHVRRGVLAPPGGRRELEQFVESVHPRLLDRRRPLWELYVISGLAGGRTAVLMRLHHALADGMSCMYLLAALLGDDPPRASSPRPSARRAGQATAGAGRSVHEGDTASERQPVEMPVAAGFDEVPRLVRALSALPSPASFRQGPFNVPVGPRRRLATWQMSARRLADLRRAHSCGAQHVVLSVIAGGLARTAARMRDAVGGGRWPERLRTLVPVTDRDAARRGRLGNRGAFLLVDLPVTPMAESVRLDLVERAYGAALAADQAYAVGAGLRLWEALPPAVDGAVARLTTADVRVNLVASYMRGTRRRLGVAGGVHEATFPVAPLSPSVSLTVAVANVGGAVGFAFVADPDAVAHLDGLAADVADATAALEAAATG